MNGSGLWLQLMVDPRGFLKLHMGQTSRGNLEKWESTKKAKINADGEKCVMGEIANTDYAYLDCLYVG